MSLKLLVLLASSLVGGIVGDVALDDAIAHGAVPPPGPPPGIPGFGGFGGGLFPGLGGGFHHNLNIGGGAGLGGGFGGPFPGGFGGLGGLGAGGPPIDGLGPEGGPVLGGGYPPLGLLGPSYIPSSWIGSALGAKGDLLFPIVLFVFFIVGIWTVVQFLLGLIVPLIATKVGILNSVGNIVRRDVSSDAPGPGRTQALEKLTMTVMDAIDNGKCLEESACHIGNLMHTLGPQKIDEHEREIMEIKSMTPDLLKLMKTVANQGGVNCSTYACKGTSSSKKGQADHNEVIPTPDKNSDAPTGEKAEGGLFKW